MSAVPHPDAVTRVNASEIFGVHAVARMTSPPTRMSNGNSAESVVHSIVRSSTGATSIDVAPEVTSDSSTESSVSSRAAAESR